MRASPTNPEVIKRTGRDRSGRVPPPQNHSIFYQAAQQWSPVYTHSADGGESLWPAEPYEGNKVQNATQDYKVEDRNRGGASGH